MLSSGPPTSSRGKLFKAQLKMSEISAKDAGKYKVVASNELGESQASISLNFDAQLQQQQLQPNLTNIDKIKPIFVDKPQIVEVGGGKIRFECKVLAKPKPQIEWLLAGKVCSQPLFAFSLDTCSKLGTTTGAPEDTYIATLTPSGPIDAKLAGEYKCVASNECGYSQATINLNFERGKARPQQAGKAPRFPKKPVIKQQGANLILECIVEAKPAATISWYHANELLAKDARRIQALRGPIVSSRELKELQLDEIELSASEKEFYIATLEIKQPKQADGGIYRCKAINEFGESNANISLNFQTGQQQQVEKLDKLDKLDKPTQQNQARTSIAEAASEAEMKELEKLARKLSASFGESRRGSSTKRQNDDVASSESTNSTANSRRQSKALALDDASNRDTPTRKSSSADLSGKESRRLSQLNVEIPMEVDGDSAHAQSSRVARRTSSVKKRQTNSTASASDNLSADDAVARKSSVKKRVSVKRASGYNLNTIDEQQQAQVSISVAEPTTPSAQQQQQEQQVRGPKLSVSEAPSDELQPQVSTRRGTYENLRPKSEVNANEDLNEAEDEEERRRYLASRGGGGGGGGGGTKPGSVGRDSLSPTRTGASLLSPGGGANQREGSPVSNASSRQGSAEPAARRGSIFLTPGEGGGLERRPSLIVPDDNRLRPGEIADRRRRSSIMDSSRRASMFEQEIASKKSTPLRPSGGGKPQIVDFQDSVSGLENRVSVLSFGVEGNPVPLLRYFKGDSEIFEGGRYFVVTEGETNTVHFCIRKSKPIDEARYRILASNEHGEDSAYMQLFVSDESGMDFRAMLKHRQYANWKKEQDDPNWGNLKSVEEERLAAIKEPKRADNFLKPMQSQKVKQGKDLKVRFECVFSKSGVKAKWFRNNKEIFPNKKFHLNSTGDLHVLEIDSPFVEDAGRYTCQCLDTKSSASLEVEDADPVYKFTKLLAKGYGQHLNRDLILECTTNSQRAIVEWYKDDKKCSSEANKLQTISSANATSASKYIIDSDKFGKKILKVKNCTLSDCGEYSCKIINTPLSDEITFTQVIITEKKFQIVKPLYSQRAVEDDKIVLECEVDELDAPVKWFKKDKQTGEWKELKPDELKSSKQIVVEGKKRRLIIKKAKCNDEGEYKCATNADETNAELFVEPSNKWRKKLTDVSVVEGEPLVLEVELMDRKPGLGLKWARNNREVGQQGGSMQTTADERVNFKLVGDKQVLVIDSAKLDDAGDWSVTCGKLKCSCKVTVLPGEKAPAFSFPVSTVQAEVGRQAVIEVPYSVSGTKMSPVNAQVLFKGQPVSRDKVEIVVRDDKVLIRFKDPKLSDSSGDYQLVLENAKGKCASKFGLKVEGPPCPPQGPLKIDNISKDSCTLSWQKPLDDGNCPIAHYVVEKQEVGSNRSTWTECGISLTNETNFNVKDLSNKKEYKFRIRAVNKKGKSEPLVALKSIIAKDPFDLPSEPENLVVANWDKNFVDLDWQAPVSDGGAPIDNYVIEAKSKFESDWSQVMKVNAKDGCKAKLTSDNCDKITENAQLQFRVKAVNKAGEGEASKATKPVIVKSRFVRPHIFGDGLKNLVVKKGRPIRYEVEFGGEPMPTVSWYINDTLVEQVPGRIEIDLSTPTKNHKSSIQVTNTTRLDSGRYKIVITNSSGNVTSEADVVVLDRPSAPEGPLVMEEVKVDKVTIKWRRPKDKGGADDLDGYVVEKMNVETGRWIPAGECGPNDESFTVCGLMKGKKYKFRVRAKNKEGESDALETNTALDIGTEPTIEKCPSQVVVGEGASTKVKIKICGEPTEASLINIDTGEVVSEVKLDEATGDYVPVPGTGASSNIKLSAIDDQLTISVVNAKLKNKARYKLKVKNKLGAADQEFDLNVTGPPGAPQGPLEVSDVNETSANLSWKPPASDGGSKVSHYLVERCDANCDPNDESAWIEVANNCLANSFTVKNLTKNHKYKFRIKAVNENGQSLPLESENSVEAKLPFDVPTKPGKPIATPISADSISLEWERPESDGGSRILGYQVEKREVGSETWQKVNTNEPLTQATEATIKNLIEDRKYEFRVSAINAAGASEPSDCSLEVTVSDPNAAQVPQFVSGLKKTVGNEGQCIELSCIVKGKPAPSVVWTRGGDKELRQGAKFEILEEPMPDNCVKHTLRILDARGDDADEYAIKATNKAGSRTSRAEVIVKTKPKIHLPRQYADASPDNATDDVNPIQFDRGENIVLKIPFTGNPIPSVKFFKGDEEIESGGQFDIDTSDGRNAILTVRNASREDSGDYKLVLSNELGSDEASISVSVSDRPEKPQFLSLDNVCEDAVTLSWKAPLWDGGSAITQYVIEKRESSMSSWIKAGTTRFLSTTIVNLNENCNYEFRVLAENIYGRSEPSECVSTTTKPSKGEKRQANWKLDENGNKIRQNAGLGEDLPTDYDKFVKDSGVNHASADIKTVPITDNYEIYEKIGEGVFGEVYRVKEKISGDFYAAKFTKTTNKEEKALIKKEIDIINSLHHTNLLRLHDAYEDDDEMITVHELISGSELLEKAAANDDASNDGNKPTLGYAMTEDLVRQYMKDICEAVRHMHDRNVIHLDLKPENLLLQSQKPLYENHEPKVKIVDFGLACKLDPHEICKISTTAIDYAAPEILEKDSVGFYTDMWAIGALTYTLLCGTPPFNNCAADIKACQWSFDSNSSVFDKVSSECRDFIEKLLVKGKEKRMTAHECLEHPWLAQLSKPACDSSKTGALADASAFRRERDAMRKRYLDWWPKSRVPIGHISNYGPLRKLHADRYKIHDALVDRRELAPRFIIKPHSTFAYETQSASFYCMVSSSTPFTITWFKDSKELKQSVKYMKRYSYNNDFTFVVNRCKLSDLGEYLIVAENQHGTRDELVLLNVQPRPVDFTPVHLEPMRKRREPTPPKFEDEPDCAPSFNFRLRPRTIQANLGLKLLCCVKAKPAATVTWLKDGRELSKKDYSLKSADGVLTLEIESCKPEDSGKYTCLVENSLGSDESVASVVVEPKRSFTPAPASSYLPPNYTPPTPLATPNRTRRSASLSRAVSPGLSSSSSYFTNTNKAGISSSQRKPPTPTSSSRQNTNLRAQTPEPMTSSTSHTLYNSSYSIRANRYLRRSYRQFESPSLLISSRFSKSPRIPSYTSSSSSTTGQRSLASYGRSSSALGL